MEPNSNNLASNIIGEKRYRILSLFFFKERTFLRLIIFMAFLSVIFYPYPKIAMWLGFSFAAYSAIANDSIQTIGTFIASNEDRKWWHLWLFIGIIFVGTVYYSWTTYGGDVSYQRLSTKGFSESPTDFHFLQVIAPLILLVLTRMRMPVSTTFMLLSVFSTTSSGILNVTMKSLMGYGLSFVVAILVWFMLAKFIERLVKGQPHPYWRIAQWTVSGALWSMWIQHDAANIAIYLNRSLTLWEFVAFTGFIFFGLGLLFYLRGDKIQSIVKEKSNVQDVRSASVIDLTYAMILFVFKEWSTIPMSTTWVFLGLLGGRELAIQLSKHSKTNRPMPKTVQLIFRDLGFATIGLVISVALAAAINPGLRESIMDVFRL